MGKLTLGLAIVGIAACGSNNTTPIDAPKIIDAAIDSKVFMDAAPPMFDLSCIGNSPPTPNATVTLSGTVTELSLNGITPATNPLAGATVDSCIGDCTNANKLDEQTTGAQGTFTSAALTTNGTAINGYVRMTHTGDRTTYAYPASPIGKDVSGIPIFTFTPAVVSVLALVNVCAHTQADGNGLVGLAVADCMGNPITDDANITVAVKQGNTVVGDPPVDAGTLSTMAAGLYLICNVPPSATTNVSATYKGQALLAHDVGVTMSTTTETVVRPGY